MEQPTPDPDRTGDAGAHDAAGPRTPEPEAPAGGARAAATVLIRRPIAEVRAQFADVAYHAHATVHPGVTFEELDRVDGRRRYRQTSRAGLVRMRQEIELDETPDGRLVNTVRRGPLTGSVLEYRFRTSGDHACEVTATLRLRLPAPVRPVGPLLARSLGRSLAAALEEDRLDLESGAYARTVGA